MVIHRVIFKNNEITLFPCCTFIRSSGVIFFCTLDKKSIHSQILGHPRCRRKAWINGYPFAFFKDLIIRLEHLNPGSQISQYPYFGSILDCSTCMQTVHCAQSNPVTSALFSRNAIGLVLPSDSRSLSVFNSVETLTCSLGT